MIYKENHLTIFFGDQQHKFIPAYHRNLSCEKLIEQSPFSEIKNELNIRSFVFLHQVHGIEGTIIRSRSQLESISTFSNDGDFIITNLARIGIGIATADCLPIILYDSANTACALIHAGWRGSVAQIVTQALNSMQQEYGTNPETLKVFFGPNARSCCYSVDELFVNQLPTDSLAQSFVIKNNNQIFFDVVGLNKELLQKAGVSSESFVTTFNQCTLCSNSFCSYRKQNKTVYRQMTIVSLQ